jgi:hypothetical protein
MYNTRDGRFGSVGFLGYLGGFPASCVIDDREFASMDVAISSVSQVWQ